MTLPDFFVIGAAKAGTTSLYAILNRHPQIFMPEVKEPEFFARDDRYAEGLDSYAERFAGAKAGQVVGEASTIYSLAPFFPQTAARIKAHVPQARIIYVMRQPVDRAYSFYVQIIKNYQNATKDYAVHRCFEDFVIPERHRQASPRDTVFSMSNSHLPDLPDLCLAGSDYVLQAETYLKHFDRDQILFLKFEDFLKDRAGTFRQITDFLGLEALPGDVFADMSVTRNISKNHFRKVEGVLRIQEMNNRLGPIWGLRHMVPVSVRTWLKGRLLNTSGQGSRRGHSPAPMEPATRTLLEARFAPQLKRLTDLTGLTFEDWLAPSVGGRAE